jgi:hypothetical protein
MIRVLLCILLILVVSISLPENIYTSELPVNLLNPSIISDYDMKYHSSPYYFRTYPGSKWCIACWFKPSDFTINENFRLRTIGQVGYLDNGGAYIYVFLAEENGGPDCSPPDFSKKKYGPKTWHINNTYPKYDDCNLNSNNWYIEMSEINVTQNKRFWIIYYMTTTPAPYPVIDNDDNKNSITWYPYPGWITESNNWCMHCVVYNISGIENLSIGTVKTLFR